MIFFIETYLPTKAHLKLQAQLGQMPTIWKSEYLLFIIQEYRNWYLENGCFEGFEKILIEMIPKNIPTVYLEGFEKLNGVIKKLFWPKYPKSIYTSNSFASDIF